MKKLLISFGIIIFGIISFVSYIFYSTGFFRKIENQFEGTIEQSIALPGVEDLQISYEDEFIILSSDDRAGRRDGNEKQGHLYFIDLRNNDFEPIQLTTDLNIPFYPHGISMIRIVENKYKVYAINHIADKHSIEVFILQTDSLTHVGTLMDASMLSPNDIVAIDLDRFYFTNDHGYTKGIGKIAEEYLGWAASNVIYFDGNSYRDVVDGIAYANGINYDNQRNLLFVASPRSFKVNIYNQEKNGELSFIEDIYCGTGVDNIELAMDGKLWIGCHPSLLSFSIYAQGKQATAPSEIITIDYQNKGNYSIETVFTDDGTHMSASTVAAVFGEYIFTGNVMDDHILVLKRDRN